MPLPLVIVIVVAVFALFIYQRMRLKQGLAQNQDKNFGAIAARLGMHVEEGDPNTNLLYFMEKMGNYRRELRASGKPYAHAGSFKLVDGVKTQDYIAVRRVTHTYGCFLQLQLQRTVASFEVVLRSPNEYLVPNQELADRTELREMPTGNAAIDAQFIVRSSEPGTAALLAPALEILSQHLFVHLAGDGNELWIGVTRWGLPYFAQAAEAYLLAIETAACALEGQALPARIAVPPVPTTELGR